MDESQTYQNLPGLRAAFYLAEKMEALLGGGSLLQ